jgi:hypothetical protein
MMHPGGVGRTLVAYFSPDCGSKLVEKLKHGRQLGVRVCLSDDSLQV